MVTCVANRDPERYPRAGRLNGRAGTPVKPITAYLTVKALYEY